MGLTEEELCELLKNKIPAEHALVKDESSGCGAKFSIVVVSSKFENMSLLDRQRLVNEQLKEEIKNIHALSMRTWTPSQWDSKKDSFVL